MENSNTIIVNSKKTAIIKFCNIFFGSIGSFILIFSVIALAFFPPESQNSINPIINTTTFETSGFGSGILSPIMNSQIESLPIKTNFVIYGLDNDRLGADVIMLAVFDRIQNTIKIVNIPRDTYVTINGRRTIIGDHSAILGREQTPIVITEHLEELFGINIDFYIAIDLIAFREIVDLVGPVPFYVPHAMRYHNGLLPSHPHHLFIDLQPGFQLLDGRQAEGLVRFRQYRDGDISRIGNQQAFLAALFSHALNTETIIANARNLARIAVDTVQTNFNNPFAYIVPFTNLNSYSLSTHTLPIFFTGVDSGLEINRTETSRLINYVFFDIPMYEEENEEDFTNVSTTSIYTIGG